MDLLRTSRRRHRFQSTVPISRHSRTLTRRAEVERHNGERPPTKVASSSKGSVVSSRTATDIRKTGAARRCRFRFSLRSLLIAPVLLAAIMWLWFRDPKPQVPVSEYPVLSATLADLGYGNRRIPILLHRKTLALPDRPLLARVLQDVSEVDVPLLNALYVANESPCAFSRFFDSQFDYHVMTLKEAQHLVETRAAKNPHWVELSRPAFNRAGDVAVVYFASEYAKFTYGTNIVVLTKSAGEWHVARTLPVF